MRFKIHSAKFDNAKRCLYSRRCAIRILSVQPSEDKNKPNKCRVLKALSLGNLVRQRVMTLDEVWRFKMGKQFFPIRQQILRRK